MIEVFKTNVSTQEHANWLIDQIHVTFPDYTANFDLTDCDRILRVKCLLGYVDPEPLINFLKVFRCDAQVLSEEISSVTHEFEFLVGQIN